MENYILISHEDIEEFQKEVSKKRGEGWELYGDPKIIVEYLYQPDSVEKFPTTVYYQAMINIIY